MWSAHVCVFLVAGSYHPWGGRIPRV
jgi:hypothetical protein